MFIISWLVIQVLQANSVIIPNPISVAVAWLAVGEALIYLLVAVLQIITLVRLWRD